MIWSVKQVGLWEPMLKKTKIAWDSPAQSTGKKQNIFLNDSEVSP